MKNIIVTAVFLVSLSMVQAQTSGQIASNMSSGGSNVGANASAIQTLLGPIADASKKRSFNELDFKGSPYTSFEFQKTPLHYKEEYMGDIFYRYNAFNQEIEIKEQNLENYPIRALGKNKAIVIQVEGHPMSFKTFVDKNDRTLNGYLINLVDAEAFDLYKRIHVKYSEGQKATNSFTQDVPNKFTQYSDYFIQVEGVNRIDEIKLKNKAFVSSLPKDKRQSVKEYIKANKLNIKNEDDLVQVFEFLNQ